MVDVIPGEALSLVDVDWYGTIKVLDTFVV